MDKIEAHKHWWWGENKQWFPEDETLIRMDFPRCFIRYNLGDAYFASFEEFYESIAEVQWMDGEKPSKRVQEQIMTEAWNFLAIEERLLEEDLENIDLDDEDFDDL